MLRGSLAFFLVGTLYASNLSVSVDKKTFKTQEAIIVQMKLTFDEAITKDVEFFYQMPEFASVQRFGIKRRKNHLTQRLLVRLKKNGNFKLGSFQAKLRQTNKTIYLKAKAIPIEVQNGGFIAKIVATRSFEQKNKTSFIAKTTFKSNADLFNLAFTPQKIPHVFVSKAKVDYSLNPITHRSKKVFTHTYTSDKSFTIPQEKLTLYNKVATLNAKNIIVQKSRKKKDMTNGFWQGFGSGAISIIAIGLFVLVLARIKKFLPKNKQFFNKQEAYKNLLSYASTKEEKDLLLDLESQIYHKTPAIHSPKQTKKILKQLLAKPHLTNCFL